MALASAQNIFAALSLMVLLGCGGGGSSSVVTPAQSAYTVGGSVSGLNSGESLVLQLNAGNDLNFRANSAFNFANTLSTGSAYTVTVKTQPVNQLCTVSLGTGVVSNAAVGNISVNCAIIPNNSLGLSPAPVFVASSKQVNYNDCFIAHTDVLVGDVATDRIEQYNVATNSISSYDTITRITARALYTFGSRSGFQVTATLDNPSPGLATGGRAALFQGAFQGLYTFNRNALTLINEDTTTPIALGDFSTGRISSTYQVGDSMTQQYSVSSGNYVINQTTTVQVSEYWTFLGTEVNTSVVAGSFSYACVFRRQVTMTSNGQSSVSNYDVYQHKASGVKTLEYLSGAPRPLLRQLVSNTAIARRGGIQ